MSNFNFIEKGIARFLGLNPKLKQKIKKQYQYLSLILSKRDYNYCTSYNIEEVDVTEFESFFGYYDKSPENSSGSKIIYHRTKTHTKRLPKVEFPVQIVCKDLKNGSLEVVAEVSSYNWQQGARLFWLDETYFIFNNYIDSKYQSVVVNSNDFSSEVIPIPVYDANAHEFILSCNFNRLRDLRPDYGYRNNLAEVDYKNLDNDGILKYDFNSKKTSIIISFRRLIDMNYLGSMMESKHKINHIMISPLGTRFIFLHRWHKKSGVKYDRLLVSDCTGSNMRILADEGIVSHCAWKNETTIIGYLRLNGLLGWYEIDTSTGKANQISNKLTYFGDGHPTFRNGILLFDSYPDKARLKNLILYDYNKDRVESIGRFFESMQYYGETRCDLHPRFNKSGTTIYIDSVHSGKRKLYMLSNN